MKRYIAVILLLIVMISSCDENRNKGEVIIDNVARPLFDSVVVSLDEGERINKAVVRLVGDVDGAFLFNQIKFEEGPIDSIIYSQDWHQPIYKIEYEPIEAQNGYLMVVVEFR